MTRQPASRSRRFRVLGTAATALTASVALLSPAASATSGYVRPAAASLVAHVTAPGHPRPTVPRGRTASPAVVGAEMAASARAQSTGRPQVVTAATTPTSITVARPNGTFQMTMNVLPVRFKVNGRWQPVSTRLRRNRGGTWSPVLVASPVTLSGGGTGPLAVLHSGGRNLAVTWPRPLPAPAITGSTATYRLARDLTLQVSVSTLGGITLAAAASTPAALRDVRLRLGGTGLTVTTRQGSTIAATSRRGRQVLFSGSAPSISGSFAGARTPGARARTVPAAVRPAVVMASARAQGGGLVLTAGPAADVTGAGTAQLSLAPDTSTLGCSNSSNVWCTHRFGFDGLSSNGCGGPYNGKNYGSDLDLDRDASDITSGDTDDSGGAAVDYNEGQLVGQDFWGGCGTNRAFYVMDTSSLTSDMRIQTAALHTWLSASSDAGCSHAWPLHLYDLGRGAQISSSTTWANQPALPSSPFSTIQVKPGPPYCTNNRDIDFSVWDPIVNAKSNNWEYWTFALTGEEGGSYNGTCQPGAANNADNCGQMRIGDQDANGTAYPYVQITFDIVPPQPQEPAGGATSPVAYDGPPPTVVAGAPSNIEDQCPGLVVFPSFGWIDDAYPDNISLRVNLPALDSRVSGEAEWAGYQITDDTEGTTFPVFYSANGYTSPATTNTVIPQKLWDGHVYTWYAWSWVGGIGANPNTGNVPDPDGPYTSATSLGQCTFHLDKSAPTQPTVTSTDFPAPGSGPTTKFAGDQGTFNFKAADNPPTNCKPNPCTVSSGLWGYAYSVNQSVFSPVYGQNTVLAGSDGTASVSITPGNWGINNLYVEAIDNAGNVSQAFNYTFYAPFNPAMTTTPGDISDPSGTTAHVADLLATTGTCTSGSSGLNLYNNPGITPAAWPPSPTNASVRNASPGQNNWACFDLTHRGNEFQQGSGLDDLWAIEPSTGGQAGPGILYLYPNNPFSPGTDPYDSGQTSNAANPGCAYGNTPGIPSNCTSYLPDWTTVTGILAIGDAWAGDPLSNSTGANGCTASNVNCDYQNQSSLVVAQSNGTLWLYQDKGGATLINPIKLGSTGWNNMTLLAPGQLDNGQLTLWARDNNTADTTYYGKIFVYTFSLDNGIPTINPSHTSTAVSATSGTPLPVTAPASTYPYIATPGDAGSTGGPNLYAVNTSGQVWVWPYTSADTLSSTPVKVATVTPGTISGLF